MGNTCKSMADSCQCMTKTTSLQLIKINEKKEKKKGGDERIPRKADKKPRSPQGERGLEFSKRRKGQTFKIFFSTFFSLSHIKLFFFFKPGTDYYTTNNSI